MVAACVTWTAQGLLDDPPFAVKVGKLSLAARIESRTCAWCVSGHNVARYGEVRLGANGRRV